ncbi:hypothetical protein DVR12_20880 [Chitinophaga silvatica]|uniref:Uncharacterized protein n=1 Tax=Chitinophaga silvatica TaxID=2282649 RepID=A0A3E1Y641_9BACT|nr:hypothetical protein [Chitinophaga silvatica]RFS20172.1 hypothetical protein DVR12_20880 [Chitinophaga silvatica]
MKVLVNDSEQLVIEHKNITTKITMLVLIAAGITMLLIYWLKDLEALFWLGMIILLGGVIGYLFVNTVTLSMHKQQKIASLKKAGVLKNSNQSFPYAEIDRFSIEIVATQQPLNDEDSYSSSESVYLRLLDKNGKKYNVFVGGNKRKMEEKLALIQRYI